MLTFESSLLRGCIENLLSALSKVDGSIINLFGFFPLVTLMMSNCELSFFLSKTLLLRSAKQKPGDFNDF